MHALTHLRHAAFVMPALVASGVTGTWVLYAVLPGRTWYRELLGLILAPLTMLAFVLRHSASTNIDMEPFRSNESEDPNWDHAARDPEWILAGVLAGVTLVVYLLAWSA